MNLIAPIADRFRPGKSAVRRAISLRWTAGYHPHSMASSSRQISRTSDLEGATWYVHRSSSGESAVPACRKRQRVRSMSDLEPTHRFKLFQSDGPPDDFIHDLESFLELSSEARQHLISFIVKRANLNDRVTTEELRSLVEKSEEVDEQDFRDGFDVLIFILERMIKKRISLDEIQEDLRKLEHTDDEVETVRRSLEKVITEDPHLSFEILFKKLESEDTSDTIPRVALSPEHERHRKVEIVEVPSSGVVPPAGKEVEAGIDRQHRLRDLGELAAKIAADNIGRSISSASGVANVATAVDMSPYLRDARSPGSTLPKDLLDICTAKRDGDLDVSHPIIECLAFYTFAQTQFTAASDVLLDYLLAKWDKPSYGADLAAYALKVLTTGSDDHKIRLYKPFERLSISHQALLHLKQQNNGNVYKG